MRRDRAVKRHLLQLAGEYVVAGQMALHGWHASPTVGNFPEVDLVAYNPTTGKRLTAQVKSAKGQGNIWGVGVWRKFTGTLEKEQEALPRFRDEHRQCWWILSGFAAQADVHVLVRFQDDDLRQSEFYVVPTRDLASIVREGIGRYLITYKGEHDQPAFMGPFEVEHFKDRWELLDNGKASGGGET